MLRRMQSDMEGQRRRIESGNGIPSEFHQDRVVA